MSWGTKIILVFSLFVALMLTLVYKSYNTKFELVSKDYYKDELEYQKVIDASKNSADLSVSIEIKQDDRNFVIVFPDGIKSTDIAGDVHFYCPYNSENDIKFALKTKEDGTLIFNNETLKDGRYVLKVNCNLNGKPYFVEKDITISS